MGFKHFSSGLSVCRQLPQSLIDFRYRPTVSLTIRIVVLLRKFRPGYAFLKIRHVGEKQAFVGAIPQLLLQAHGTVFITGCGFGKDDTGPIGGQIRKTEAASATAGVQKFLELPDCVCDSSVGKQLQACGDDEMQPQVAAAGKHDASGHPVPASHVSSTNRADEFFEA
jgi:hypothetical protein